MNRRNNPLPYGISLKTERAESRLADAGILRAHQLHPRHWQLLHAFAGQELKPFIIEDGMDGQRPARLQLNTDETSVSVLQELAQLGLIRKHPERDPETPRQVLRHVWLISPHMVQAVREAVDILAEDNADNAFFTEPPGIHARRLERTRRETNLLRLELLDMLTASPGDHTGKVSELMDSLHVEADPHWYGIALIPAGRRHG